MRLSRNWGSNQTVRCPTRLMHLFFLVCTTKPWLWREVLLFILSHGWWQEWGYGSVKYLACKHDMDVKFGIYWPTVPYLGSWVRRKRFWQWICKISIKDSKKTPYIPRSHNSLHFLPVERYKYFGLFRECFLAGLWWAASGCSSSRGLSSWVGRPPIIPLCWAELDRGDNLAARPSWTRICLNF